MQPMQAMQPAEKSAAAAMTPPPEAMQPSAPKPPPQPNIIQKTFRAEALARMQRAVMAMVAVAVGCYYLWGVRAAGNRFSWGYDLGGYYDYLGRGFAHGHLYVPIEPSPQLLALANPWDPAVDDSLKMQDMALYNGRYYLYHGAGPALILFAHFEIVL